jgi:hypothetical protein
MADITVTEGAIGSPIITLTANEVSTVTFAEDLQSVTVITDGTAEVWWTCDRSEPSVGVGWYIPAVIGADDRQPTTAGGTVVKLVSTGAPNVRVQRGQ